MFHNLNNIIPRSGNFYVMYGKTKWSVALNAAFGEPAPAPELS
jgi:hypothetical protein